MRIGVYLVMLGCVAAISPAWAADPAAGAALAEPEAEFRTPAGAAQDGVTVDGSTGGPTGSPGALAPGSEQGPRLLEGVRVAANAVAPVQMAQATGTAGTPPAAAAVSNPWIFRTSLYAWIPFATESSTISTLPESNTGWPKTDVNLVNLYGGAGEFQLSKGDWGLFANVVGGSLGYKGVILNEDPSHPRREDRTGYAHFAIVNGQYGLSYRLLGPPLDLTTWARGTQPVALDLMAGAQTFYFSGSISTQREHPSVSTTLTSPVVATRLNWDMTPRWNLGLGGGLGGFGVSDTTLTWQAALTVAYRFHLGSLPTAVNLGFGVQGTKFETGSGTNYLKVNEILYGPMFGFSTYF